MNQEKLKQFVLAHPELVTMRESKAFPGLYVLKYKNRVFYDNLWNDVLEECRGTIIDADFNVVARPFTKVYNYGIESRAPKLKDNVRVTAYRKVNGFMVALTMHNDQLVISTTGSTDSDFVQYAKEMMVKHATMEEWKSAVWACHGYTLMFECVHPSDPHIVPEEAGMYFIGWRENSWDGKVDGYGQKIATHWRNYALTVLKCNYAESFDTTIGELVAMSKQVRHEGFVFYTESGEAAKIKSPFYLVNKFVARNPRTDKLLRADAKEKVDEEYYKLIDAIRSNIDEFTALTEQQRLAWVREFLETKTVITN